MFNGDDMNNLMASIARFQKTHINPTPELVRDMVDSVFESFITKNIVKKWFVFDREVGVPSDLGTMGDAYSTNYMHGKDIHGIRLRDTREAVRRIQSNMGKLLQGTATVDFGTR